MLASCCWTVLQPKQTSFMSAAWGRPWPCTSERGGAASSKRHTIKDKLSIKWEGASCCWAALYLNRWEEKWKDGAGLGKDMHYKENKTNGRCGKQGMKRDEEAVCGDFKGEEGWREAMESEREEWRINEGEARRAVCLRVFQPTAVKRGFEWSYQVFCAEHCRKWPAARGEGVTRSLACDGWQREAGSASTRYIIIHLLLSPKPPTSEPLTHQDTFLLQPKAAWLIHTETQADQGENVQKLL